MLVIPDDRLRPRVRTSGHVLFLLRLGVADQQDAGRGVGKEDGHRELSLVSEKSSPGGGALTSVIATTREHDTFILRSFGTVVANPPCLLESAFLLPPLELR